MKGHHMGRAFLIWTTCATTIALIAGCSATSITSMPAATATGNIVAPIATNRAVIPEDTDAFAVLSTVAPESLKLEGGTVSSVACWTPSEHLFHDTSTATATTWKVICRVYYLLAGFARYQDATCIGDFTGAPMLDHCYVWEYYSYEPRFSDGDRLAPASPSPAS